MYRKILLIAALLAAASLGPLAPAHAAEPSPFTCRYHLNAWQGGFTADLFITNNGPTVNGWRVHWTLDEPTQLLGVWAARMEQPSQFEMVALPMDWNKVIPSGSTVVFGWTAFATKTEVPTDITVNGLPC